MIGFISVASLLFGCGALAAEAERGRLGLAVGFDSSVGNYGARLATDILQIPVTATYGRGPLRLKLTIPFREINGRGNVVLAGTSGTPVMGRRPGEFRGVSGLGDIVAGAAYNALYLPERQLLIDLAVNMKIPTSDEAKGLGTGETDFSLQADAVTERGGISLIGTIGYEALGSPDAYSLKNTIFMRFGGGYQYGAGSSAGLTIGWRQAASPGINPPFDTTIFVNRNLSPGRNLYAYILKGWSSGSPDLAFGVNISQNF